MMKRVIGILALALMLSPAVALAGNVTWDDGGADHDWSTAGNWSIAGLPLVTDDAYTKGAGAGVTDVTAADATCKIFWNAYCINTALEHWTTIHSGGVLTVADDVYGGLFNNAGHWNLSGITVQSGGTLAVADMLRVVHPSANFKIGAVLDTSGTITVGGAFQVSRPESGWDAGTVYLRAGTITCGSFGMYVNGAGSGDVPPDYMDITGGILYISGDVTTTVEGYVDNGWLEAYGGAGTVNIEYEETPNRTKVWATPIPEPGTMLLAGFGVLLVLVTRRKR